MGVAHRIEEFFFPEAGFTFWPCPTPPMHHQTVHRNLTGGANALEAGPAEPRVQFQNLVLSREGQ